MSCTLWIFLVSHPSGGARRVPPASAVYFSLSLIPIAGESKEAQRIEDRAQSALANARVLPLDATGICAVAGSGFGQEPGTYHVRVTALCPGVEEYVGKIEEFHKDFMKKWA